MVPSHGRKTRVLFAVSIPRQPSACARDGQTAMCVDASSDSSASTLPMLSILHPCSPLDNESICFSLSSSAFHSNVGASCVLFHNSRNPTMLTPSTANRPYIDALPYLVTPHLLLVIACQYGTHECSELPLDCILDCCYGCLACASCSRARSSQTSAVNRRRAGFIYTAVSRSRRVAQVCG